MTDSQSNGQVAVCAACCENEAEPDLTICVECLEWYGHLLPAFRRQ